eukprot:CAMPEP_0176243616 /NCGR_PEP_ID=MMETSP0121_2-20121125/31013_1 /TAXON_ID=160619 /ORGANISM="Kryptoperidinium foliaceum, Strain CCMP 1326" /LENGTH=63 /DNA_ID=CAMNT_0017583209 /DNA_START=39 /DNA_END=231 /DNA_ORIENTATION=-
MSAQAAGDDSPNFALSPELGVPKLDADEPRAASERSARRETGAPAEGWAAPRRLARRAGWMSL